MRETKPPALRPLVATLFGLVVAFHLGSALFGKSIYRAYNLGTVLEYAHGSIDLLRPVIVGFTAAGTPTAQELPVWQAAAALAMKAAGSTWYGWANLVSLIFFATSLWPLFQLARRYVGERAAWWATAFYLAEPLMVIMAGEAAPNGFSMVVTLWFVYFADALVHTGRLRWWWPTALFAILSALSKMPFFFSAGLFSVFLVMLNGGRNWRPGALLAAAGAVTVLVFAVWTRYTDSQAAQAEYIYTELRLSHSPFMVFWYFGDLHYRLGVGHWVKGGWRFVHATMGVLPMSVLLIAALLRPGNRMPKLWLLATFLSTLVFTHVVLEHWHYYLMCCPAVALLCGTTLARWEEFWLRELARPWLVPAMAALVLAGSAVDGAVTMKVAGYYDYFPRKMSDVIRQYTRPEDKLIVYNCDPIWGGEVLFRSGRMGLSVPIIHGFPNGPTPKGLDELLDNPSDLRRLKALGYNKLVLISESPVQFAITASNPGSQRQRMFYPPSLSSTVDAWPLVFRSEDILIREIP